MQRGHLGARARHTPEDGFTLIELMMVVLIIAILIAFLLPTFNGARQRANDRAMQSSLRNALTASKAVYVDGQDYTLATPARLNAEGVPVKFVAANQAPSSVNEISVDAVSASYIVLSGQSKSGTCFYVADDANGAGTTFASMSGGGGCAANGAPAAGNAAWKPSW
jgi:prepilin-type N-terminal cleavage/methylation domain-containing protein